MNFRMKVICLVFDCLVLLSLCFFVIVFHHSIELSKRINHEEITTVNVTLDAFPSSKCPPHYDGFCMNEGQCYFPLDVNAAACLCKADYGGRRCKKFLWYHWLIITVNTSSNSGWLKISSWFQWNWCSNWFSKFHFFLYSYFIILEALRVVYFLRFLFSSILV